MAGCRSSDGKPVPDWASTLLGEFALDGCLDEIRQISTDLGARPYRVFLVRTRWSGKERGQGVEVVVSETELTPTPKVDPVSSVNRALLDVGMDEVGQLNVSEISPRYKEWQLLGIGPDRKGVADNETFSWEVQLARNDGGQEIRRRFLPSGVPNYEAENLQWTVRLNRAGADREMNGSPG